MEQETSEVKYGISKVDREGLTNVTFDKSSGKLEFRYEDESKNKYSDPSLNSQEVVFNGVEYEVIEISAHIKEIFNYKGILSEKIFIIMEEELDSKKKFVHIGQSDVEELISMDVPLDNCIIVGDIILDSAKISRKVCFDNFIIIGGIYLSDKKFLKPVSVSNTIITGDSFFKKVEFEKEVDFVETIFLSKVSFERTRFAENAGFYKSYFRDDARFFNTQFLGSCNFRECIFNKLDTTMSEFRERLDFTLSFFRSHFKLSGNIKNIFLGDIFFTKEFVLQIDNCVIEGTDFSTGGNESLDEENTLKYINEKRGLINIEGENAFSRETFLQLKHFAIKQNDTISAVMFHTKEHDKYLHELGKTGGNLQDKFTLSIEKLFSYFGTAFFRVFVWQLAINIVFLFIHMFRFECCVGFWDCLDLFGRLVIPIKLPVGEFGFWNFLQIVANAFLTYELVKSFRKFSRKF